MDAVQKVGNGHPGTAMSLAPVAYTLFQRILKHDPSNPQWINRDRFILSCGHSSLTLYIQLFLSGYGLELEDLKNFRTLESATPGHPEYGHTVGVETTTGPLGQGVANAVGMAMASRYVKGLFDSESKTKLFVHNIWVLASDGDLQEGISAEVFGLSTLRPLDTDTVVESVKKTNRLVCCEEGWRFMGVGAEIAATVVAEAFDYLDAPPIRVHQKDVPLPYAANLEALSLPNADDIVAAAKKVCEGAF